VGKSSFTIDTTNLTDVAFLNPTAIAVAPGATSTSATLYVCDYNHSVRKLVLSTATSNVASLFAGVATGKPGFVNGDRLASAQFNLPRGIDTDSQGNVFVADTGNNVIRKIDIATGLVSTFAGSPSKTPGYIDGTGTNAVFNGPQGISIDKSTDDIYVADTNNNRIRKISKAQVVTTAAGTSSASSNDGPLSIASFNAPTSVFWHAPTSILYVIDSNGKRLRKVDFVGQAVSTLAGADLGTFSTPTSVTVDSLGNAYVADGGSVKRVTPTGVVSTLAGSDSAGFKDGVGNALFNNVNGLVMHPLESSNTVLVADASNNRIRRVSVATGDVSTFVGASTGAGFQDGTGIKAQINTPGHLCMDYTRQQLLFADTNNHKIRSIGAKNALVTTLSGDSANTPYFYPSSVALDSRNNSLVYVCDCKSHRIRLLNLLNGAVTNIAGSIFPGFADDFGVAARFSSPSSIVFSPLQQALFVADTENHRIRRVNVQTNEVTTLAGSGVASFADNAVGTLARFNNPQGIAIDSRSDTLFIADSQNNRIRKVSIATGSVITIAGQVVGLKDGTGTQASFNNPTSLFYDEFTDALYIADTGNNAVRVINGAIASTTNTATVKTLLNSAGTIGSADGLGITDTSLFMPTGVALLNSTLFVACAGYVSKLFFSKQNNIQFEFLLLLGFTYTLRDVFSNHNIRRVNMTCTAVATCERTPTPTPTPIPTPKPISTKKISAAVSVIYDAKQCLNALLILCILLSIIVL